MSTLYLDADTWDLTLDAAGRIKTVDGDYATAQNVSNAVRAFTRDMYFNQLDGVPHFDTDVSRRPQDTVIRSRINRAARLVPGVARATTTLTRFEGRTMEGEIAITTTANVNLSITI